MLRTIPRFAVSYGVGDYLSALAALSRRDPPPPHDFAALFGARATFWTSSGRQALCMMLRALQLPADSGVAVPVYSDPSVYRAVRAAGLRPVFVDIVPATLTMDPADLARVRDQVAAVVVLHLFGQVAHMDRLVEVADGLPLVEDTAHAPLSYHGDAMVGSFGVGSFYSFASSKYWPAAGGGLAVVGDRDIALHVADQVRDLKRHSWSDEFTSPLPQLAKATMFHSSMYRLVGMPVRRRTERHQLLEPQLSDWGIQRSQAAVALRQVPRMRDRVQRQRANSLHLLRSLGAVEDAVLPRERDGVRYNYHIFPVVLRSRDERTRVAAAMLQRGVDTSSIYHDCVEYARSAGYEGGCPASEAAAAGMLSLPNYASLSRRDLDRVAEVFLASLRAVRRAG